MKVHEILPGQLYQRGKFSHFSSVVKEETFRARNIGLVIGLAGPHDDYFVPGVGPTYWHTPIPDGKFDTSLAYRIETIADMAANFILSTQKAVLVHCNAGRNRSSLLNALVLMRLLGVSGAEAAAYVMAKRPNALGNVEWKDYLDSQS